MIRTKIVEIRETNLETANDLLRDPHWTFVTAVTDNNAQKVKYVLKRRGTYDDEMLLTQKEKPCVDLGYISDVNSKEYIDLKKIIANHYRQLHEFYSSNSCDKTPEQ